jgi:hypothetical protein
MLGQVVHILTTELDKFKTTLTKSKFYNCYDWRIPNAAHF